MNEVDRSYVYQVADVFILCFSTASARSFADVDKVHSYILTYTR